ncbi:hypothetical protein Pmani_035907 [Petrolisthes manimaculis]|uniref:Uncharacterized protein n=1 Tax=Petrolisthes manimaculis TaxID=1843537 RepID=A0AAE1NJL9_9EUCA|nr:hypothetical protein Pmani_035907 [Petrolisthes manimaculis]
MPALGQVGPSHQQAVYTNPTTPPPQAPTTHPGRRGEAGVVRCRSSSSHLVDWFSGSPHLLTVLSHQPPRREAQL